MNRIIALGALLFLSGCITLNVNDILGENKCDFLLAHSSDIKMINACYQDRAMLYAVAGNKHAALQSCSKLLQVRAGSIKSDTGSFISFPINYLYDVIYPVWLYKSCVVNIAKISRDKALCSAIDDWDSKLFDDPEYSDLYNKMVSLMQKGTNFVITGPGGFVDYMWPGLTQRDCEKEVEVVIRRDEIASKSLFDIIES